MSRFRFYFGKIRQGAPSISHDCVQETLWMVTGRMVAASALAIAEGAAPPARGALMRGT